MNKLLSTFIT